MTQRISLDETDPRWRHEEPEGDEKSAIVNELESLVKERVYVSSRDDAPEDVEVQEGDQGGLYYETGSTEPGESEDDDDSESRGGDVDLTDAQQQFIDSQPEVVGLVQQLNSKFGPKVTQSFMRNASKVVDHIEPEVVAQASQLFLSRKDLSNIPIGLEKAKEGLRLAKDVQRVNKGRRYVESPDEVPDEYEVQEGPQGGLYYEVDEEEEEDMGAVEGRWFDIDELQVQEGMHVRDVDGNVWEVEAVDEMDGIGTTIRGRGPDGEVQDFFPEHDDDLEAVYAGDEEPSDPAEEWVPYINEQGERGFLNTETGDFEEGAKDPPVELEGEDVTPENPLQEGDYVKLEYDGEEHYGFVHTDRGNGEMLVIDDRSRWDVPKEGFSEGDSLHGMMDVERIGQPEDTTVAPEDVTIDSVDDAKYVLDEIPNEGASRLAEALQEGHLSVEEAKDAAEESWGMLSIGSEMMERGAVSETSDGNVSLVSGRGGDGEEGELRRAFKERVGEDTAQSVSRAARGWEQGMYKDPKAANLIQYAMNETGNETVPEYARADTAANQNVSEEEIEAIKDISQYTTEKLREAFGDEVTVFRGFAKNPHQGTPSEGTGVVDTMEQAKENGESVTIEHRPVESWSLNPEVASLYGAGGAVVKQTVPVEDIIMSSSTGFPDESEEDTLLMSDGEQEYDPDQIILDEETSDDEMTFELRAEAVKEAN